MKDNMSFATDNWEEFEKLSISILETYLPADSEISYSITHTPNRKDGGYDGLIIIASDNKNMPEKSSWDIIAPNKISLNIFLQLIIKQHIRTSLLIKKWSPFCLC